MPTLPVSLAVAAAITSTGAQQNGMKRELKAVTVPTAPVIDGDLSDEVWKSVPEEGQFWDTQNSVQATEQTLIKIAYDANNIYISYYCKEPNQANIVARETQEDSYFQSNGINEDAVAVVIDPYFTNNDRDQDTFLVTPLGTKSVRLAAGRANKREWKGEWKAACKRVPDGWTAEMQIPWKNFNYPGGKNLTMGLNFARVQAKKSLQTLWSNIGNPGRNENGGRWLGVTPPPPAKQKVQLLPYLLPGTKDGRGTFRSGLDAKAAVTQDMTAVVSLNPDFGTIEGAVEGISFSRSERFVQEKRPFFLEGQQYLQAGGDGDIGLFFYPRRIDRFDLGVKLYGKLTKNDSIGILNTMTFGDRLDFVAKLDHRFNDKESINYFVNHKNAVNDEATLASVNYTKQWGKIFIDPRGALSVSNQTPGKAGSFNIGYEDKNNFFYGGYQDLSTDFRIPDGLLGFTGYKGFSAFDDWHAEWRHGYIKTFDVSFQGNLDWHYFGNQPFRRGLNVYGFFLGKDDLAYEVGGTHQWFDNVLDNYGHLGITRNFSNRTSRYGVSGEFGQIANMPYSFWGPNASQRFGKHLDISAQAGLLNLGGHDIQSIVTATYEFSPTRSVGGRLVDRNGDVNWYLSYRESGSTGMETYVILGDPNADKFRRIFQVKLVIPFQLG